LHRWLATGSSWRNQKYFYYYYFISENI